MGKDVEQRSLADQRNAWTVGGGPVWCPVATMRKHLRYYPSESDTSSGNQHFALGAKLYLKRIMGYQSRNGIDNVPDIEVIGRHRGSHRYAQMIIRADWVENWRIDLVYSPHVIRLLWPKWDGTIQSRQMAEQYVIALSQYKDSLPDAPQE